MSGFPRDPRRWMPMANSPLLPTGSGFDSLGNQTEAPQFVSFTLSDVASNTQTVNAVGNSLEIIVPPVLGVANPTTNIWHYFIPRFRVKLNNDFTEDNDPFDLVNPQPFLDPLGFLASPQVYDNLIGPPLVKGFQPRQFLTTALQNPVFTLRGIPYNRVFIRVQMVDTYFMALPDYVPFRFQVRSKYDPTAGQAGGYGIGSP